MSESLTPPDPNWRDRVEGIFSEANFIRECGFVLVDAGPGWVETALPAIEERHLQQDTFVHAGVLGTLADHSAGACAGTMAPPDRMVLTVEYKLNLLRPAVGRKLRCRAELLKAGKTLTVCEASVYVQTGGEEKLVAKATVTLALVPIRVD